MYKTYDKSVLVDLDKLDNLLYMEFYPRISHKQRKKIIDCVRDAEIKKADAATSTK